MFYSNGSYTGTGSFKSANDFLSTDFFGLLITLVQDDGEPFATIITNMKQVELFVGLLDL